MSRRRPPIVLYYHQLVRQPPPPGSVWAGSITPEQFRTSMEFLREHYHPLHMEEMCHHWYHGRQWPDRSVVITFDDGFRNNLWAAQILHELGMSATFFVLSDVVDSTFVPTYLRFMHVTSTRRGNEFSTPTGPVDFGNELSKRRWMMHTKEHLLSTPPAERLSALEQLATIFGSPPIDPDDMDYQYVSSSDLHTMVELGMTIGGHGATHEKLTRCTDAELQYELVESREKLAGAVGRPIEVMSYPDGRFDDRVLAIAGQHYKMAFSAPDVVPPDHPYRYPRRPVGAHPAPVLSWTYRPKRRCIEVIKRVLRITSAAPTD